MADFKTHMVGAALVSGVATTGLMLAGILPNRELMGYFALGVMGGLLPDVDSDTSIPIRMAFNVLAVVLGFLAVLYFGTRWALVELVLLWGLVFVGIRYGLFKIFTYYTVHRGLIHSIPAGLAFGLGTVLLADRGFGATPLQAWMCGAFVAMGFMVHLLLDEAYSVDLAGRTLKRSFGSAFNLGSLNNLLGTLALYALLAGLFYVAPSPEPFLNSVLDDAEYWRIDQRLLPTGGWFEGLLGWIPGS